MLRKCSRGQKNRTKRDVDDNKRALMKINEGEGSSHAPLYGISRIFAENMRSMCRNICRVCAEYAISTRKMGTGIWAPSPWMGVIIEEHFPGGHLCLQGNSSLPMYVLYSLCTYHQAESIRTNRNHLIRMKIQNKEQVSEQVSSKQQEASSKDGSFNQSKVI